MPGSRLLFCLAAVALVPCAAQSQNLAPGVAAPDNGTVYALAPGHDTAQPLVKIPATDVASDSHAGSNFARGMVYSGPRLGRQLDGAHASTHVAPGSVLFVRVGDDNPELLTERTQLLRLKVKDDRRVVSTYSQNVFGGSRKRSEDIVPTSKTAVAGARGWIEVVPSAPLPPGEYAIVQDPKDPNTFAVSVFDFGVATE